jgi:putative Mg2+ transporter-C (MgtC) family protein
MDAFIDTLSSEFARSAGPPEIVIVVRLLGAALMSAIIGIERELRDQAAGMRTTMLVGIASATFGMMGIMMLDTYDHVTGVIRVDPLRLIEAVTGGVAFLAAGLIVYSRGKVHGLTTGAAVWLAAASGLSVGMGHWFLATAAALGGLLILAVLRVIEKALGLRDAGDAGAKVDGEDQG